MKVVFPDPFGPRKPNASPRPTSMSTSTTPTERPYIRVSARDSIA